MTPSLKLLCQFDKASVDGVKYCGSVTDLIRSLLKDTKQFEKENWHRNVLSFRSVSKHKPHQKNILNVLRG